MNINELLFTAAQLGNIEVVKSALSQGADPDYIHDIGITSLYIASQNGHAEVAELLLRKGADPEVAYHNGMTPLCVAAHNGHLSVVKALIEYGADIEAKVGNTSVIHLAAQNGKRDVVRLLLSEGARLEANEIIATKEQSILEVLLQQGANRIKTIGCYDGISKEIFAQEGIDYDSSNRLLMEDSGYRLLYIKDYQQSTPKIPLITHHIYFTSTENPREIDDLSLNKTVISTRRLNEVDSNWKHYIWTNNPNIIPDSLRTLGNVEVRLADEFKNHKLYEQLETITQSGWFAQASDLYRYMVLDKFGGVYFDLDYEIYRAEKLLPLVRAFNFLGGKELPQELTAVGNSFIASSPEHPIIRTALDLLERNSNYEIDPAKPEYVQYPCTKWHRTWLESGPMMLTIAVFKATNKNNTIDVIMPDKVFYNFEYAQSHALSSRCHNPQKIVNKLVGETIGADMFCGSWSANENFLNLFYYPKNNDAYLFEAASWGYTEIVEYFLTQKHADINAVDKVYGATALHIAIQNGHLLTVMLLVERGADIKLKASNGLTPLCIAVQNQHIEIAKFLIEKGVSIEDVFPSGVTPLYVASYLKNNEMIFLLLESGANKDKVVLTAVKNSDYEVLKTIAASDQIKNDKLFTAAQTGDFDTALKLIGKGANVNMTHQIGASPLYIASQNGYLSIVSLLIENGAEIDFAIADGRTSLFIAAFNGHRDIVEALLKAGANKEIESEEHTPLYAAIYNDHMDIVELLLDYGAQVQSDHHFTPLVLADMLGKKEVYDLLVEYYLKKLESSNQNSPNLSLVKNDLEIVVVRYNENLSWVPIEFQNQKVTIYNKGQDDITLPEHYKIVRIPNMGYFGGTILYHIAEHYEDLSSRVLFLQGDPYAAPVFLPFLRYSEDLNSTCKNIIAKCGQSTLLDTSIFLKKFDWKGDKHGRYKNFKVLDHDLIEFTHKYISKLYLPQTSISVCYGAEFAVDTLKIKLHPVDFYQQLLDLFNKKQFPMEDHYIEKLWDLVFQEEPSINTESLSKMLFNAANDGQIDLVRFFINAGANIEYAVNGHTPLYAAIYNGHKDVAEFLLKSGASIESNENRFTPMFIAASKGLNKKANQGDKVIYGMVLDYYWRSVEKTISENQRVESNKSFEVVVARFNEPTDWIAKEFPTEKVTIYNKGDDILDPRPNWTIFKIPNIGLEPFSYLTHIVTNYNNLADRTLFLQGIPYDHPVILPLSLYKENITSGCINIISKCENTSVQAEWDAARHTVETKGWMYYDGGKYSNVVVRNSFLEFMNKYICPYPLDTKFNINWGAEFALDKEAILSHPVEYYSRFLETLDIQFPAEVHWLERLWDLVFQKCPYEIEEI